MMDKSSDNDGVSANVSPGIQFQFELTPAHGVPVEIADGIWWIRLPISSTLEYVNVYALRDGGGLTLVDTGVNGAVSQAALESALHTSPLSSLPLRRVIVTHFHPDHIGLAGVLARRGAELWMSRTCWLTTKMLMQTSSESPKPIDVEFMRLAGLSGIELEAFKRRPANRFLSQVAELPETYVPLFDNATVNIGFRTWTIRTGSGHAAEHITMWSDGLAILGDQILPSISSNLTVPFTEPDADLVSEWIGSCVKLQQFATDTILGLPGHQRPYTGVKYRLEQIQANMESAMERLAKILVRPSTALECLEQFHNRVLPFDLRRQMLPEMIGFLNHLTRRGEVERKLSLTGAYIYTRRRSGTSAIPHAVSYNKPSAPHDGPAEPHASPKSTSPQTETTNQPRSSSQTSNQPKNCAATDSMTENSLRLSAMELKPSTLPPICRVLNLSGLSVALDSAN